MGKLTFKRMGKRFTITFFLTLFLGMTGLDKFYQKKYIQSGIKLILFSLALKDNPYASVVIIWWLVDITNLFSQYLNFDRIYNKSKSIDFKNQMNFFDKVTWNEEIFKLRESLLEKENELSNKYNNFDKEKTVFKQEQIDEKERIEQLIIKNQLLIDELNSDRRKLENEKEQIKSEKNKIRNVKDNFIEEKKDLVNIIIQLESEILEKDKELNQLEEKIISKTIKLSQIELDKEIEIQAILSDSKDILKKSGYKIKEINKVLGILTNKDLNLDTEEIVREAIKLLRGSSDDLDSFEYN